MSDDPYGLRAASARKEIAELTLRLTEEVTTNAKLSRALTKFVKWFDSYSRDWKDVITEQGGDVLPFYDLQEIADEARAALGSVKG